MPEGRVQNEQILKNALWSTAVLPSGAAHGFHGTFEKLEP